SPFSNALTAPAETPAVPQTPGTPTAPQAPSALAQAAAPEQFAGLGGATIAVADTSKTGYIDSAIILNQFRLRYDAGYDDNRPDRAEFFYGKCGCFRHTGKNADFNAPGPPKLETHLDYQDIGAYFEGAITERFSAFVETPFRFLNPV